MIAQVSALEVNQYWPLLRAAAMEAVPPYVESKDEVLGNILSALLRGQQQGWLVYEESEDGSVMLLASIVTEISTDPIAGTRNLVLYAMFGFEGISLERWYEIRDTLMQYALANGCYKVVAYTNSRDVVGIVKHLGGHVEYRFVAFDVIDKEGGSGDAEPTDRTEQE